MIFFTHVQKTSGTSFKKALVDPNLESEQVYEYKGLRRYALDGGFRRSFVWGHVPFGVPCLPGKDIRYITFLRDPVDRAVSYYYFIKDSDLSIYKHPLRDEADSMSIAEFFEQRRHQNLQTQFISGLRYHNLYPRLRSDRFDRAALRRAISNLTDRYYCFGLQERYEDSLDVFQQRLGWDRRTEVSKQKTTSRRPRVADLDSSTRHSLEASNSLDCALYEFASERFESQVA